MLSDDDLSFFAKYPAPIMWRLAILSDEPALMSVAFEAGLDPVAPMPACEGYAEAMPLELAELYEAHAAAAMLMGRVAEIEVERLRKASEVPVKTKKRKL